MEGEYKMFIDSLSERNKSKNAVKASTPVSNYHFSRKIVDNLLSDFITIDECFHSFFRLYIFKGNYSLVKMIPLPL